MTLAADGAVPYEGGNGPAGTPLTVAIGPKGSLVAAGWRAGERSGGVFAWAGTVTGGFDAAAISVAPGKPAEALKAAIGSSGRRFVAWGWQASGEDPDTPWLVQTASIARGARAAGAVGTVEHGTKTFPIAFPALTATRDGGALLAWSGTRNVPGDEFTHYPVRLAPIARDGRIGPVEELAADGALAGLAPGPRGAAIVTWAAVSEGETAGNTAETAADAAYYARVRSGDASAFSPTERVPVPFPADLPLPAFDPTGRPALAITRPNVSGSRGQSVQLLLRDRP